MERQVLRQSLRDGCHCLEAGAQAGLVLQLNSVVGMAGCSDLLERMTLLSGRGGEDRVLLVDRHIVDRRRLVLALACTSSWCKDANYELRLPPFPLCFGFLLVVWWSDLIVPAWRPQGADFTAALRGRQRLLESSRVVIDLVKALLLDRPRNRLLQQVLRHLLMQTQGHVLLLRIGVEA